MLPVWSVVGLGTVWRSQTTKDHQWRKRVEKLRYIHRNPVKRGLVEAPELWPWNSFRAYAHQESGIVGVNEWNVVKLKYTEVTR